MNSLPMMHYFAVHRYEAKYLVISKNSDKKITFVTPNTFLSIQYKFFMAIDIL